jgi:hypothetical protein
MSATTDVNKPVSDWNLKTKSRRNKFQKVYFYTKAINRMKDDGYKIRDEFGVYYLTFCRGAMGRCFQQKNLCRYCT